MDMEFDRDVGIFLSIKHILAMLGLFPDGDATVGVLTILNLRE